MSIDRKTVLFVVLLREYIPTITPPAEQTIDFGSFTTISQDGFVSKRMACEQLRTNLVDYS
jgi:hypothetical protein